MTIQIHMVCAKKTGSKPDDETTLARKEDYKEMSKLLLINKKKKIIDSQ